LGYPPGGTKPADTTNHRNGMSEKTVPTGARRCRRAWSTLIRRSLDFANWKERKPLRRRPARDLHGASVEGAGAALDAFERGVRGV
jgi:hypothetical protein